MGGSELSLQLNIKMQPAAAAAVDLIALLPVQAPPATAGIIIAHRSLSTENTRNASAI